MNGTRYTPLGKATLGEWRRTHPSPLDRAQEMAQASAIDDVEYGGICMSDARYTPLGQAVGILETCIVRRDRDTRGYARHLPRRGRFLVWRPGEDDLSDLTWYSFTEIAKKAEEAPA